MKTKYIFYFIVAILIGGCSEDFLETLPIAKDTEVSFYSNFDNLDMTATAAYGMLSSRDIFDIFYTIGFGSAADDVEMGGEGLHDWPQFQHIDQMVHTASEDRRDEIYGYCYKGIRMANDFLYFVEDIRANDERTSADLYDQRIAEMKFLRAYYHFTLSQIYGGIPVVIAPVSPSEYEMPRQDVKTVYAQIEKDLKEALPDLPKKGEDAPGRATQGAANALLAKVLLYESSYAENYPGDPRFGAVQNRYAEALSYAEAVITAPNYGLVGIDGSRYSSWWDTSADTSGVGGFRWLFSLAGDNSEEAVWEIQAVQDGKGWTVSRGNYITVYTSIRFYNNNANPGTNQTLGWSFNLPTNYLIDAFGNQDSRETGLNSSARDAALDPRFNATVGQPGDLVYCEDGSDGVGWYSMNFSNLPTNTIGRKFECAPDEYWRGRNDWHDGPINLRMIRMADVYLMAAEAAFKSSNTAKALEYVNAVRTRARMSGDTGYPVDLTTVSFEDIVHERRIELALEGHRFFDLVRWNLAEKYIDGIHLAALGDGFSVNFVKGKHEFFPLSATELQLNPGLEQYDAWK